MNAERYTPTTTEPSAWEQAERGRGEGYTLLLVGLVYLGIAAFYLIVPVAESTRMVAGHVVLLASMAFAAWSCLWAAWRSPPGSRLSWYLFAGAASAAVVGQAIPAVQHLLLGRAVVPGSSLFFFLLVFHPLFSAGAAVALRPARKQHAVEVLIDGSLIIVVSLLFIGRFAFPPAAPGAGDSSPIVIALAQIGALSSCLFAGLLVLWGDPRLPGRAVPPLAGTAAAFLAVTVFTIAGYDPAPNAAGDAFDLGVLSGWFLLGLSGLAGARGATDVAAEAEPIRARLRRAVAPGAALCLGVAALDAALYPGRMPQVAVASMLLAALLMFRIRLGVKEAERRAEQGIRLAHTEALVQLNRALAGETELSRTLDLVAQWACRLLDAGAAGIELLSEDGTTLELRSACGLPDHVIGLHFPIEGSFTGWVVRQRRPRTAETPRSDPFIRPETLEFLEEKPMAAAPLRFGDRVLGALFAANRNRPFDAGDLELLGSLADQAALAIENAQLFEQVHALSLTDPLTGLANRRQLERDLRREFAAAQRGRKLVLVLFDLDEFKEYNDRHGHLAGDEVLRTFGQVLIVETRAMNLAVRYGGDEFLVLLAEATLEGARQFVQRVETRFRAAIAQLGRSHVGVSAGLAVYDPAMDTPEDLIALADRMLYESKGERSPRSST